MEPDEMFVPPAGGRPDLSRYTPEVIRQALGEVRGLARAMDRRGAAITAAQLRCLCDLVEAHVPDVRCG